MHRCFSPASPLFILPHLASSLCQGAEIVATAMLRTGPPEGSDCLRQLVGMWASRPLFMSRLHGEGGEDQALLRHKCNYFRSAQGCQVCVHTPGSPGSSGTPSFPAWVSRPETPHLPTFYPTRRESDATLRYVSSWLIRHRTGLRCHPQLPSPNKCSGLPWASSVSSNERGPRRLDLTLHVVHASGGGRRAVECFATSPNPRLAQTGHNRPPSRCKQAVRSAKP